MYRNNENSSPGNWILARNFLKKIFWPLFLRVDCSQLQDASIKPLCRVCSQKLKFLWPIVSFIEVSEYKLKHGSWSGSGLLRLHHGYCPFAPKWRVVLVDPLSPNLRTEGNFQARFSQRKSIGIPDPYRLTTSFFALRKYFDTHFWGQCVMPGVVWWVVWAESPIQI